MRRLAPWLVLVLLALAGWVWFAASSRVAPEQELAAVGPRIEPVVPVLARIAAPVPEGDAGGPTDAAGEERAEVVSAEAEAERLRAAYPRARLFGEVTDLEGDGIEGVAVRAFSLAERWVQRGVYPGDLRGLETVTDAQGRFELTPPVPTSKSVSVEVAASELHTSAVRNFALAGQRIVAGDNDLGTFVLQAAGVCTGRVTDTGVQSVGGATVTLSATWPGSSSRVSTTLKDGSYRVGHLVPGSYSVEVVAQGFLAGNAGEVEILAGEVTREIDLRLERGLAISGRVTDAAGDPLTGVQLWGLDELGGGDTFAVSAADGYFSLPLLGSGNYSISAWLEGYAEFDPHHERFVAPGTQDLLIALPEFETTTFLVLDDRTGAPIERFGLATVPLRTEGTEANLWRYDQAAPVARHARGEVELPGAPLIHNYSIVAPGYAAQRGAVEHDLGGGATQTLRLAPGGTLMGRLVAFGEPLPWPALELSADLIPTRFGIPTEGWGFNPGDWYEDVDAFPQQGQPLRGGADGRFEITDLAAGTYELVLAAGGHAPRTVEGIRVSEGLVWDLGDIEAFRPAELSGWITLDGERSAAGLVVSLGDWLEPDREQSRTTGNDGAFVFTGLAAGVHYLWVDAKPGVLTAWEPTRVELGPGELRAVPLDLSFRIASEVAVRVRLNGEPAANMSVEAWPLEDPRRRESLGATDPEGFVRGEVRRRGWMGLGVFGERGQYLGGAELVEALEAREPTYVELELDVGRVTVSVEEWIVNEAGEQAVLPLAMIALREGANWWSPHQQRADWVAREGFLQLDLGWLAPGGYAFELTSETRSLQGSVEVVAGAAAICGLRE